MRTCKDGFGMSFEEDFDNPEDQPTAAEIEEARLEMIYGVFGPPTIADIPSEEEMDNRDRFSDELDEERAEHRAMMFDEEAELDLRD